MADENNVKMAQGLAALGRKRKKKKLLSADEFFKIKDSKQEFTGPKSTKGSLGNSINKFRDMDTKIKVIKMKSGGRAGYKHGGAAIRGQGCEIKS
jgi:hypothetical protein